MLIIENNNLTASPLTENSLSLTRITENEATNVFFIQMGPTLGIFLLLHFAIGKYPTPLPKSADRRREIWQDLRLWAILVIAVTIAVLIIPQSELVAPTFKVVATTNLALSPF